MINMEDKTKGRGWSFEKASKTLCVCVCVCVCLCVFFFLLFLVFGGHKSRFWLILGGLLGPSWGSWGDLGGVLGVLGPSWRRLGTSGSAWERLGASDHFWLCLGAGPGPERTWSSDGIYAFLGPYCKQQLVASRHLKS